LGIKKQVRFTSITIGDVFYAFMVLWFDGLIRLSPCQLFKLLDAPHTPFSFSLDQQFWMV